MQIMQKLPLVRKIRETHQREAAQMLDDLRKHVGNSTNIREALADPGYVQNVKYPFALQKGTFTHPGRVIRKTELVDQPAFRNQWPLQRILIRNLFEIMQNMKHQATEKNISHIDLPKLKEVSERLAKSLVIVEGAIREKAPTRDGEVPYSRWWRSACRSLDAKEHKFVVESLRETAAFFLNNTHPETAEKLNAAARTMIHHLNAGRRPSFIARSGYTIGTALDIIGDEVKLPLVSQLGKAVQAMTKTPPEHTVALD